MNLKKQYGGGAGKIMQVLKCKKSRAAEISEAYDLLYSGLGAFSKKQEMHGRTNGYIECAFGLRLKTPKLGKRGPNEFMDRNGNPKRLTQDQSSEARSGGNAATQSYGMLINRAAVELDQRTETSDFVDDIKLTNTIHDAIYGLVKNTPEAIKFVNDNLIDCMAWQDDPALKSNIKLEAEVDFGPSWDKQYTMKNDISIDEVKQFLSENSL